MASQQPLRGSDVFRAWENLRRGVLQKQGQRFQWPGELAGSMLGAGNPGVAADQVLHPAAFEVARKKSIRIEEVGNDLSEAGEVGGEFRIEFRARVEESSHGSVFDGSDRIRIEPSLRNRADVPVSDDFDPAIREPLPEQTQGGQGEQEIPDGSATDDKDAWLAAGHKKRLP